MANRCILPVIRQPYVHVPVVAVVPPAVQVDTPVQTEVETEVQTEVETEVQTEVETEVHTEVETEVHTEAYNSVADDLLAILDGFGTSETVASEAVASETVTETKRGRKPKNAQPEPFAP
jgi:hypothetical protein